MLEKPSLLNFTIFLESFFLPLLSYSSSNLLNNFLERSYTFVLEDGRILGVLPVYEIVFDNNVELYLCVFLICGNLISFFFSILFSFKIYKTNINDKYLKNMNIKLNFYY